jgi:hypothetical protein
VGSVTSGSDFVRDSVFFIHVATQIAVVIIPTSSNKTATMVTTMTTTVMSTVFGVGAVSASSIILVAIVVLESS